MLNTSEDYLFDIMVLVTDKENLLKFINDIETLNDVIQVERLIK